MVKMLQCLVVLVSLVVSVHGLDNGLALTPPMGWMSWERFRCNIDCKNQPNDCIGEKLFMDMADRMVEDGFKDAGYEYVNIDDCWASKERDSAGKLQADPDRFPSGIKKLADYVHSRGLKLGIYNDFGTKTCGGYPGSLGHLEVDAKTFAEWGVDMLKMDGCYADVKTMPQGYPNMTKALNATGRPILFSCSWPDYERASKIQPDYKLIAKNCNIWRNYIDIQDSWDSVLKIIDYYAQEQDTLAAVSAPGSFNDPDMLIIGDFSLSVEQAKAQMAMWSILAAPMLMSNDLRTISPEFREILLNKEVIQINQDPSGKMGKRVMQSGNVEVWSRELGFLDEYALAFLNRGTEGTPLNFTVQLKDLGLRPGIYFLIEIFEDKDIDDFDTDSYFSTVITPNGVSFIHAYPSQFYNSV
ncbi:alpha-N-acetylgalactosaminidase-like isoform X1 [Antedon mediterranea]|uniref:alpha-N-acetylgalactosaminidase-like isoform X1 n=1 Tax=Antedon mediterranea TaxID=105859 RepID=UPI003AF92916